MTEASDSPLVSVMVVPFRIEANVIVSAPVWLFALMIAWRSEPAPESAVVLTM